MATNAAKAGASAKPKAKRKKSPAKKKTAARKPAAKKSPARQSASAPAEVTMEAPAEARFAPPEETVTSTSPLRAVRGIRERDITSFMRQMIMLLEAGTPMLKALNTLANRGERQAVRTMVKDIATQVEEGSPLWQAFGRHSNQFPAVFVNLIKAGEASGTVIPILRRVVIFREKRAMLARRMRSAMLYPVTLIVFCFAVVVLLAKFVIPQFVGIFETFDIELRGYSGLMIGFSQWIGVNWWLFIVAVIVVVVGYRGWFVRNAARRTLADRIKIKVPIFGPILRRSAIIDFTRTFSILIRSGLSMMATLDLCRDSVSNRALINVIQDMRDSVERGEGLEKPLRVAERAGIFPGVVVDMLVTGEETGRIDEISEQIAVQYEEEVEIAVDALGEAIQPVATVFMGFVVGAIVFALFTPLISMIEQLSG